MKPLFKFSEYLTESNSVNKKVVPDKSNRTEPKIKEKKFEEFSKKRLAGATKIVNNAKEKGGPAMLTYYHFVVKLPYYEKASKGNFDVVAAKKEFEADLEKLCKLTTDVEIAQIEFQKLVGRIEVLGELLIKCKK